jgi:hypothetical protein
MNDLTAADLDGDRFAIGQPVPRAENPVLLRGGAVDIIPTISTDPGRPMPSWSAASAFDPRR